ncbi:MAG: ABC transporter ATP-binding protein [Campylobacterales bacterium]|nr:ABC transporter ATP-binding protein [Campylobacterales bacterium]
MSLECKKVFIKNKDRVLVDICFKIEKSLALVGESGSGKSLTLKALLGLIPSSLHYEVDCSAPFELKRGESVSFVPQNPFTALSPLTKIKDQFFHNEADEFLKMVKLDSEILKRFPPELSGGQLQRVVIAMAISTDPKLILLDEPTTALDLKTTKSILKLLKNLQNELNFSMLFVTHDIDSAKELCEDIVVLKNGKVVEEGKMQEVLKKPKNPYTKALIEAGFSNKEFRK